MARSISGRLVVSGELVASTALHVGGLGEDVTSDMPLARDGAGRFVIPGTSLAGAFRAWCEQAFTGDCGSMDALWGFSRAYSGKGSGDFVSDGAASRVMVEDIVAGTDESAFVEIRDGVGIDREWGTAAHAIKYDRAVLPRGARLPLQLTIDFDEDTAESARAMAAALVAALADGEIALGAAKTRGLGRVRLEGGRIEEFHLGSKEGMLALLRRLDWAADPGRSANAAGGPPATKAIPPCPSPHAPPRLAVEIEWEPLGPLMVKAGADGIAVDTLPLLGGTDGGLTMLLPGSSIKGVLRSQAERIVRTLLDLPVSHHPGADDADDRTPDQQRFLGQLRDIPLVSAFFGAAGEASDDDQPGDAGRARRDPADSDAPVPGRGALSVEDCHGSHRITRDQWADITAADIVAAPGRGGSPLRQSLTQAGLEHWAAAFHVAVDRWTGGAADQLLFTVLEPHAVSWEPMRLAIDLPRLHASDRPAGVMLLLLLLRDLADGRLPLGFGVNRGMGAVAVKRVRIRGRNLGDGLSSLADVVLERGDVTALPAALQEWLDDEWGRWLAASAGGAGA